MSAPKVLIQIALMENGELGVNSSSGNQITNLGMIEIAKNVFLNQLNKKNESGIIVPDAGITRLP